MGERGGARVREADRQQLCWDLVDLESQLPPDHEARVVWRFVESLDLSELYAVIKARDEIAGRPAADPKVLLALWLYATLEGIGSARLLERLCRQHAAYRWLCGGVSVNYHGLSDFRWGIEELLDRLLTESVTVLAASGAVQLQEIVVDGTKVIANASPRSFRDERGIGKWEARARERIAKLKSERDGDGSGSERRRQAAQARARQEVETKAAAALEKLKELAREKERRAKTHRSDEAQKNPEPKVSTTDPSARVMRMPDQGFRPAYTVMVSADPSSHVIVGVMATDRRNESGLLGPMLDDFNHRYGMRPERVLVDERVATRDDIIAGAAHPSQPTRIYRPVPEDKEDVSDKSRRWREAKRRREPDAIKAWRAYMTSEAGRQIYRHRKRIELVNAQIKNRGLRRLVARGFKKIRCEVLLHAVVHNMARRMAFAA